AQPAHFLQGELALPVFDLLGGGVVEVTFLVAIRHHQRPTARGAAQGQLVPAGLDVGKPFAAAGQRVAQRGVGVDAFAFADDAAVGDRAVAAAIPAIARPLDVLHAALVEASQAGA